MVRYPVCYTYGTVLKTFLKFVQEIGTEFVPRILFSNIGMDPIDLLAIQRILNTAFWPLYVFFWFFRFFCSLLINFTCLRSSAVRFCVFYLVLLTSYYCSCFSFGGSIVGGSGSSFEYIVFMVLSFFLLSSFDKNYVFF
jgi:hypothetical protein